MMLSSREASVKNINWPGYPRREPLESKALGLVGCDATSASQGCTSGTARARLPRRARLARPLPRSQGIPSPRSRRGVSPRGWGLSLGSFAGVEWWCPQFVSLLWAGSREMAVSAGPFSFRHLCYTILYSICLHYAVKYLRRLSCPAWR